MLFYIFTLSLCLTMVTSDKVNSHDCPGTTLMSENIEMKVSGCSISNEWCPLIKGDNHIVDMCFSTSSNITDATQFRVYGVFPDTSMVIPYGRSQDACNASRVVGSDETCASHKGYFVGKPYCLRSNFFISPNYPAIKLKVRFLVRIKRSKAIVCCKEVPVEIKNRE